MFLQIDFKNVTVKEFKYWGIYSSRSGCFSKTKKHVCEQAHISVYCTRGDQIVRKLDE